MTAAKNLDDLRPMLAYGEPNPKTRLYNQPAIKRVMYRTAVAPSGCWEWQGYLDTKGYGKCFDGSARVSPHLVVYIAVNGHVPPGLEIDHLCFNRACVRPEHLEAVTHAENVRRGRHNQNHGKPNCDNGHPFSAENTQLTPDGRRACRTCARLRMRAFRARQAVSA